MIITSTSNEKVKFFTSLKQKKYREQSKLFLIEGSDIVDIAIKKNLVVDLITIKDDIDFDNKYIVTKEIMSKICNQVTPPDVCATVKFFDEQVKEGNAIVLDDLQDPGNIGTIIRSCVAFGFKTVFLGSKTVDIYNDKLLRSTKGAIFDIAIKKVDLINNIDYIKSLGYKVVGTSVTNGTSINKVDYEKIALIIGNEGSGMNENILVDENVFIDMFKETESLNAAVAASILMYEVYNEKNINR